MSYEFNEHQLAWLHDLETTDAPQCGGMLAKHINVGTIGYCCLGRAELVVRGVSGDELACEFNSVLRDDTRQALRMWDRHGRLKFNLVVSTTTRDGTPVTLTSLAALNDNGWTFKQIAEFIRANPEKVFE